MRRPSEKGGEKEEELGKTKDLSEDKGEYGEDEDEVMVENDLLEGSLVDNDEDQGGGHLQKPRPKKPKVPHKKIKIFVDTQKEMDQLEAELQKTNPDKKFVKKAMDTTFLQRRRWIQEECPSVQEILLKYPIFKKSKEVSVCSAIESYSRLLLNVYS